MIVINGQLMPAHNIPGQANALKKGPKTGRNRFSLINELRNKTLAKRSANFDISKLKGTFQTTDLASKKKDDKVAVDPLALETEKGIIEEDEDIFEQVDGPDGEYDPNEENDEKEEDESAGQRQVEPERDDRRR